MQHSSSFERLEGLISHPLFIFNSKNVEEERRGIEDLLRDYLVKTELKSLRSIIDVIKLGKEAFSLKKLHCYAFEPVKKCSLSVLLSDNF